MVMCSSGRAESPLVVFAGGGTGGHLFPALSVMSAIRQSVPAARFLLFATDRSIDERVLNEADCEFVRQSLPRLDRHWRGLPSALRVLHGMARACRARLANDRPSVVIASGGFSAIPALREAHRLGVPIALLNPDSIPGRVNRCFAISADAIFVQWEDTANEFPEADRVLVTGCPIRQAFQQTSRAAGTERFMLDRGRKTLLVTGASQGAKTINEAVLANLDLLAPLDDWQVLHLTGQDGYIAIREAYVRCGVRATVLPFTDHMADALCAADLVVSRAGASTLAEITAVGVASILMPYPFHRDQHQMANAQCLARSSAAAVVQDTADPLINGPVLGRALESLMRNDAGRNAMADAAGRMGRADAADRIADAVVELMFGVSAKPRSDSLEQFSPSARYESGVGRPKERAAKCQVR